MALDALRVALQGLYRLTPIAMAVQGLIDELEEEWRTRGVLGGSGYRRRKAARARSDTAKKPARRKPEWDLREAHQAEEDRLKRRMRNNMIVALVSAAVTEGML